MHFNSPLSSAKADELIGLLELAPRDRVIDVGCGTGEFLARIVERFGVPSVGVDVHAESLAIARRTALERVHFGMLEFVDSSILDYDVNPDTFACAICMGSTHAYSPGAPAYPEALKGLSRIVRPGGKLLIGESYWIQDPPQEYLDFVGEPGGTCRTHLENVELAVEHGLIPHYATTSSLDEWDDFEWRHNMVKEAEAAVRPGDPEAEKMLERSRAWRMAYLRWGRGTLGFGFYLFLKP